MQKCVAIGFVASCVALFMILNAGAVPPPSDYNKNNAVFKTGKLADEAQPLFDQYHRLKDSNRLDEPGSMGFTRGVEVSQQMRRLLTDVEEDYLEALQDGWEESDEGLKKVRQTVEEMRAKMEPCGLWTSFRFGEPYLRSGDYHVFNGAYDSARSGAILVGKGELDEGARQTEEADEQLIRLKKQIEQALDNGEKGVPSNLEQHPAYLRTVEEIQTFRNQLNAVFARAQEARGVVAKDVEAFLAVAKKCTEPLKKIADGGTSFSGTIEEINQQWDSLISELVPAQQSLLPEAEKALAAFRKQFGDGESSQASINIANNIQRLLQGKVELSADPGSAYTWLEDAVVRFKEKQAFILENITADIERLFANPGGYREESVVQTYDSMKARLQLAAKMAPENAKVKELVGQFDAQKAKAVDAVNQAIDARVWNPNSESFQGPGDPAELITAAREFLIREGWCEKPKSVIIAARIDGDWRTGDLNLLGQPLNWQLGMEVAFQSEENKAKGLAQIFYLSFYTRDADKKLPWGKTAVGDNYLIRASKIKNGSGCGSSSCHSGFTGRLCWLALVAGNLLAGLLAAAPLLMARIPASKKIVDALSPWRQGIGLAALAIGLVSFLRALVFHFAPLADLLPQVSAILAGLLLDKELLLKKRASAVAVEQKAQDLLARNQAILEKLQQKQVPLGVACLALGLLHLLMGGATLF